MDRSGTECWLSLSGSVFHRKVQIVYLIFLELYFFSCGDYASGTNHTLPTYGYARMYSGVSTATFQKHLTSQVVTEEGIESIGSTVCALASLEGLEAHRRAVEVRQKFMSEHRTA